MHRVIPLYLLAFMMLLCGCEDDGDSSSSSSSSSTPSAPATTTSGEQETFWNGTEFDVNYKAVNDTSADAKVRIRGTDGGSYTHVVKANSSHTFWAKNKKKGLTVYLEVWVPNANDWWAEDTVTLNDRDVTKTVKINKHWYGGLGSHQMTID